MFREKSYVMSLLYVQEGIIHGITVMITWRSHSSAAGINLSMSEQDWQGKDLRDRTELATGQWQEKGGPP